IGFNNLYSSSPPVNATAGSQQGARPVPIPGGHTTIQPSDIQKSQQNLVEPGNAKSWGSIVNKDGKKVGVRGYKPQDFQEEFPSLGSKELNAQQQKTEQQQQKPSSTSTEQPYGPGPSLRPQNVGSWKEGGGSLNKSSSANDGESKNSDAQEKEPSSMSVRQMSINGGAPLSQVPHVAGTPQLRPRGMIPPYAYGARFQNSGPGANYPGNFHTMQPQPASTFNHYPDKRMPAPNRGAGPSRRDDAQRPAIISEKTLLQLDDLENDLDDSGWAGAPQEVDYGEKLVFSDDESQVTPKSKNDRKNDADTSNRNEEDSRSTHERPPLKTNRERDERTQPSRQAWSQPKESTNAPKQSLPPTVNQPQQATRPPLLNHPTRQPTPMGQQRWHSQGMATPNYEPRPSSGHFQQPPNRFVHPHGGGGGPRV
ncbi:protein PRRC2B-like, partial [Anneissia japonica]|uniref:protein PRRC2B-like n=1 Tax=Anneissia japonica TaxID=1529436 RepID=UPI001425B1D6